MAYLELPDRELFDAGRAAAVEAPACTWADRAGLTNGLSTAVFVLLCWLAHPDRDDDARLALHLFYALSYGGRRRKPQ